MQAFVLAVVSKHFHTSGEVSTCLHQLVNHTHFPNSLHPSHFSPSSLSLLPSIPLTSPLHPSHFSPPSLSLLPSIPFTSPLIPSHFSPPSLSLLPSIPLTSPLHPSHFSPRGQKRREGWEEEGRECPCQETYHPSGSPHELVLPTKGVSTGFIQQQRTERVPAPAKLVHVYHHNHI